MVHLSTKFAEFSRKGLDKIVTLQEDKAPKMYTRLAKNVMDAGKERYKRVDSIAYFGYHQNPGVGSNAEYFSHPTTDMLSPFTMDVTPEYRALAFVMSSLAAKTDFYEKFNKAGTELAKSRFRTKEYDFFDLLNRAATAPTTGNGLLTLDGVALASASHPLETGTKSNLTTSSALAQSTLEAAATAARRRYDHRGNVMQYTGSFTLVVPPELELTAWKLVHSNQVVGSNNNELNPFRGMSVLVCPYLTSSTTWFLVADEEGWNPFLELKGADGPYNDAEYTKNPRGITYLSSDHYKFAVLDWRGIQVVTA